ncbi:MAG: hypothetical protein D6813_02255 [Calditrichaeota bacterium]|nr:MAG: hypothetical protein D6813_02255 [Calditrichota bacterium]
MKKALFCLGVLLSYLMACTENPFGGDEISQGNRLIKGKVRVNDATPENVYVWLEGFNLSARTDNEGNFQIVLPPPSGQSSAGGVNGIFKMYFYLANYHLQSIELAVQDGEFLYSQGPVNSKGELNTPVFLTSFLKIETRVEPSSVNQNSIQPIGVFVKLTAVKDSVTVINPRATGGFLGAAFLRNKDTGEVFIVRSSDSTINEEILVTREPVERSLIFNLTRYPLTVGKYEVIPFILVRHEPVPENLIRSLGKNVEDLNPAYLSLPFKRQEALLEIF